MRITNNAVLNIEKVEDCKLKQTAMSAKALAEWLTNSANFDIEDWYYEAYTPNPRKYGAGVEIQPLYKCALSGAEFGQLSIGTRNYYYFLTMEGRGRVLNWHNTNGEHAVIGKIEESISEEGTIDIL